MENLGVRAIVVCPPEVTDTFNMKLFELQNPKAREKSRELSAKLGTKNFVTIAEVANKVHKLLENPKVKNGHIQLFGGVKDGLTPLSMIYGNEAIYVTTYQKIGDNLGVGRLIVNPSVWKRDEEPSFAGEIVEKDEKHLVSKLKVTKEYMRGHFHEEIALILPGHKSIRITAIALGQLLHKDSDTYLSSYDSVKFRSPILPGKTITTKITLTSGDQADASIYIADNDKSVLDIKGLKVKKLSEAKSASGGTKKGESVLFLDQLLEAAAQTVGLHVLYEKEDLSGLPMFLGTEKAELVGSVQTADDLLIKIGSVKILNMQNMQVFTVDVRIYKKASTVAEELVATIKTLQGIIVSKEELLKKLEQAV
jgi:3-hydroxymyristoyl/3-hydroxydecanoyl-(acyl carrier protein) dehydratase